MMVSSITEPDGNDKEGNPYWNDGSGVTVLESVYTYGNTEGKGELFGCGKSRELDCILKKPRYWEIWRQK